MLCDSLSCFNLSKKYNANTNKICTVKIGVVVFPLPLENFCEILSLTTKEQYTSHVTF